MNLQNTTDNEYNFPSGRLLPTDRQHLPMKRTTRHFPSGRLLPTDRQHLPMKRTARPYLDSRIIANK